MSDHEVTRLAERLRACVRERHPLVVQLGDIDRAAHLLERQAAQIARLVAALRTAEDRTPLTTLLLRLADSADNVQDEDTLRRAIARLARYASALREIAATEDRERPGYRIAKDALKEEP